tara:strand:+ start:1463 stop:2116 length:654 start_codon:yes stop_codon:yes gene_type:complete
MARFQIFVPHTDDQQVNDMAPINPLTRAGLVNLVAGSSAQLAVGPEDQKGVIISWVTPGDTITGYHPEQQTWIPAAPRDELAAKRYWVGIWNDKKPTPNDLKRNTQHPGRMVVLGDGQEWMIPNVGSFPNYFGLDNYGKWVSYVRDEYRECFDEAMRWREVLDTLREGDALDFGDVFEYVANALSLNYMLTGEVISELKLFGQSESLNSLCAVCEVR